MDQIKKALKTEVPLLLLKASSVSGANLHSFHFSFSFSSGLEDLTIADNNCCSRCWFLVNDGAFLRRRILDHIKFRGLGDCSGGQETSSSHGKKKLFHVVPPVRVISPAFNKGHLETKVKRRPGRPPFLFLVDFFNDLTVRRIHEIGAILAMNIAILAKRRRFAVHSLRKLLHLDRIR
jgi:hypothetical protein